MTLSDSPISATADSADLVEAQAHELMARAHGLLARAARMRSEHPSERADDLVAITDTNLGARTRRRLEREGRLPVVKLGRRKFTRRSALAALVDERAAPAVLPKAPTSDPREAARSAYQAAALARSRRSA